MASTYRPRTDLPVTNVGLSEGVNGRQIADAARRSRPRLKTLFITCYAETAALGDGHLAAGMHVMTRPSALETLASRERELLLDD